MQPDRAFIIEAETEIQEEKHLNILLVPAIPDEAA